MKIIGLDVGEKRIGVARADSGVRIATPVGFVLADGTEWEQIAKIANIYNTKLFVLGLPRSNNGNETKQSAYVRQFARTLATKIPGAKICFQDESLTSVEAEERLRERHKKYERGNIDAEAAAIILQDFLERIGQNATSVASLAGQVAELKPEPKSASKQAQKTKQARTDEPTEQAQKTKQARTDEPTEQGKKQKINKLCLILIIVGGLGLLASGGYLLLKSIRAREREEYFAKLESEMKPVTFNFTIRPGETIFDIKRHLLELDRNGGEANTEPIPNYTEAEIDAAFQADYDFEFLAERPAGASLEGFLYPETHNFYGSDTVEDVLRKFLEGMDAVIRDNELSTYYSEQGLTLYEGITLASIVQKEATAGEQPTVAQVFLLRNKYGWNLGSDVTVSYALDVVDPERQKYTDNQSALTIDSCYNTRLYAGLPCGPIANPGLEALLAVAHPSDTSYLFFLTGDDGLMYYSYTESEHYYNRTAHCQTLCNVSL